MFEIAHAVAARVGLGIGQRCRGEIEPAGVAHFGCAVRQLIAGGVGFLWLETAFLAEPVHLEPVRQAVVVGVAVLAVPEWLGRAEVFLPEPFFFR